MKCQHFHYALKAKQILILDSLRVPNTVRILTVDRIFFFFLSFFLHFIFTLFCFLYFIFPFFFSVCVHDLVNITLHKDVTPTNSEVRKDENCVHALFLIYGKKWHKMLKF